MDTLTDSRVYSLFEYTTSESSDSGFNNRLLASKTRPVSLKLRSFVADDARIENNAVAKRDNCGYIHEYFLHHDKTPSPLA